MTFSPDRQKQETLLRRKIQQILVAFEQNRMKFKEPPIIKTMSYKEAEDALTNLLLPPL